jgi:GPI ethanolamine phosphate transferase 3 subunit O
MLKSTAGIILLLFYLHGVGLWLFVRGFLLSRLSLSEVTACEPLESCTLPPTHKRAVLLVIDALRFDFISPDHPNEFSPNHHGVLTLPAELTAKYPQHSFIYNSYSDPPTTTLQRIKGITTGSLPTFVEMGSNFGASEIEEDSIIRQLRKRGKKVCILQVNFVPLTSIMKID